MSDDLSVFTGSFKIYANDVDVNAKLKITSLLDFLQNTAWDHYNEFEKKYGKILSEEFIWAIIKIKLKVKKIPYWNEKINIKTWSPFTEKFFAYRNFEISDATGKIIGKASFAWVIVDIKTQKPVIPENFVKIWHFYKTELIFDLKGKIEKINTYDTKKETTVSYSDVDINNHVNNVKYIQWIVDSINPEILFKKEIRELESNFISESKINEELFIENKKISDEPLIYSGKITKKGSDKEVCRAKITFL